MLAYPTKKEKKPRRKEDLTVFILHCGDKVALRKRGSKGLLADLWEYPNVSGHLSVENALRQAEAWGTRPLSPQKIVNKEHIFTHVEWQMQGVYIMCSCESLDFVWATPEEVQETYALPTAFRQFSE